MYYNVYISIEGFRQRMNLKHHKSGATPLPPTAPRSFPYDENHLDRLVFRHFCPGCPGLKVYSISHGVI